jgi:hypothetical protein
MFRVIKNDVLDGPRAGICAEISTFARAEHRSIPGHGSGIAYRDMLGDENAEAKSPQPDERRNDDKTVDLGLCAGIDAGRGWPDDPIRGLGQSEKPRARRACALRGRVRNISRAGQSRI